MARTTVDVDNGELLEGREVLVGRNRAHIYDRIVWKNKKKKFGKIKTTLYYDPNYKTPDYRLIDGKWYRHRNGSQNPGMDPESWSRLSSRQRQAITEFHKENKMGILRTCSRS